MRLSSRVKKSRIKTDSAQTSIVFATACETGRETSAIPWRGQKFHAEDVSVLNPDRSADWLTEQFSILTSKINQCF